MGRKGSGAPSPNRAAKTTARREVTLPSELLIIILEYLCREGRDLIRFSSISRSWKAVADLSPLWLSATHYIFCPEEYYLFLVQTRNWKGTTLKDWKNRFLDKAKNESHSSKTPLFFLRISSPDKAVSSLATLLEEGRIDRRTFLVVIEAGERTDRGSFDPPLSPKSLSLKVSETRSEVIKAYQLMHQSWRRELWISRRLAEITSLWLNKDYRFDSLGLMGALFLFLAKYSLGSLQVTVSPSSSDSSCSSLTWLEHVGFSCIYLWMITAVVTVSVLGLKRQSELSSYHNRLRHRLVDSRLPVEVDVVLILLGLGLLIAFLHWKYYSCDHSMGVLLIVSPLLLCFAAVLFRQLFLVEGRNDTFLAILILAGWFFLSLKFCAIYGPYEEYLDTGIIFPALFVPWLTSMLFLWSLFQLVITVIERGFSEPAKPVALFLQGGVLVEFVSFMVINPPPLPRSSWWMFFKGLLLICLMMVHSSFWSFLIVDRSGSKEEYRSMRR